MTRQTKVMPSLGEAIRQSDLRDGMTISFHHHLREGDRVLNSVLAECSVLGLKDLTVNASALMGCHRSILDFVRDGTVTGIECNFMHAQIGQAISRGALEREVVFRSHGGRPAAMDRGESRIDVAFIAASAADATGNCNGKQGNAAFGSIGYAMPDAEHAQYVVVVTDQLFEYPLIGASISEESVDAVVVIDSIGDPLRIMSGTTRVTRDPIGLLIAEQAAKAIGASGLLRDGFTFQTGAGGTSLAVAQYLGEIMREQGIVGRFASGGITGLLVNLLREGLFETLLDVQCFDREAVLSIGEDARHGEISATRYASPAAKSSVVDHLDVVILGATEIDTDFNVNVHTDSNGVIMGGSGGHSDTAAGAKLSIIVAPIMRARMPLIVDRVGTISTPGEDIDLLVTQYGLACNPRRSELASRLERAGLPVVPIHDLKAKAESITGVPTRSTHKGRPIARVISRDGMLLDTIAMIED